MDASHRQSDARVRFDWGLDGALAISHDADVVVVVDVLSFTTAVTVALERGTAVLPYPWEDEGAAAYARARGAMLAAGRSRIPGAVSLSPSSLLSTDLPPRLVLPSPNGSTIVHALSGRTPVCLAASLRNAGRVAAWVPADSVVAVVAAGERWPDGGLRPAAEDLWGAGAVIAALATLARARLSPEADAARAAYEAVPGREATVLAQCASGRELIARGYAEDVAIAAQAGVSTVVPRLAGDRFEAAG